MAEYYADKSLGQEELDLSQSTENTENLFADIERQKELEKRKEALSSNPYDTLKQKEREIELNTKEQIALLGESVNNQKRNNQINLFHSDLKNNLSHSISSANNYASEYARTGNVSSLTDNEKTALAMTGKLDVSKASAVLNDKKIIDSWSSQALNNQLNFNRQNDLINSNYQSALNKIGIRREFQLQKLDELKKEIDFMYSLGDEESKMFGEAIQGLYNFGIEDINTPTKPFTTSRIQGFLQPLIHTFDEIFNGAANIATLGNAGQLNPIRKLTDLVGITQEGVDWKDGYSNKYAVGWETYLKNPSRLLDLAINGLGSTAGMLAQNFGVGKVLSMAGKGSAVANQMNKTLGLFDDAIKEAKTTGNIFNLKMASAGKGILLAAANKYAIGAAATYPFRTVGRAVDIANDRAELAGREYSSSELQASDLGWGGLSALMDTASIPAAFVGGKAVSRIIQNTVKNPTKGNIAKALTLAPTLQTGQLAVTEGLTEVISTVAETAGTYGISIGDIIDMYNSDDPKNNWIKEAIRTSFVAGIAGGMPLGTAGSIAQSYQTAKQQIETNKQFKQEQQKGTGNIARAFQADTNIKNFDTKVKDMKFNEADSKTIRDAHDNITKEIAKEKIKLDSFYKENSKALKSSELSQAQRKQAEASKKEMKRRYATLDSTYETINKSVDALHKKGVSNDKIAQFVSKMNAHFKDFTDAKPEGLSNIHNITASVVRDQLTSKDSSTRLMTEEEFDNMIKADTSTLKQEREAELKNTHNQTKTTVKQQLDTNPNESITKETKANTEQSSESVKDKAINAYNKVREKATSYMSRQHKARENLQSSNTFEEANKADITNIEVSNKVITNTNKLDSATKRKLFDLAATISSNVDNSQEVVVDLAREFLRQGKGKLKPNFSTKQLASFLKGQGLDYNFTEAELGSIKDTIYKNDLNVHLEESTEKSLANMTTSINTIKTNISEIHTMVVNGKKPSQEFIDATKKEFQEVKAQLETEITLWEQMKEGNQKDLTQAHLANIAETINKITNDLNNELKVINNPNLYGEFKKGINGKAFSTLFKSMLNDFSVVMNKFLSSVLDYFIGKTPQQTRDIFANLYVSLNKLEADNKALLELTNNFIENTDMTIPTLMNETVILDPSNYGFSFSRASLMNINSYNKFLNKYFDTSFTSIKDNLSSFLHNILFNARKENIMSSTILNLVLGEQTYLDIKDRTNMSKEEIQGIIDNLPAEQKTFLEQMVKASVIATLQTYASRNTTKQGVNIKEYETFDNTDMSKDVFANFSNLVNIDMNVFDKYTENAIYSIGQNFLVEESKKEDRKGIFEAYSTSLKGFRIAKALNDFVKTNEVAQYITKDYVERAKLVGKLIDNNPSLKFLRDASYEKAREQIGYVAEEMLNGKTNVFRAASKISLKLNSFDENPDNLLTFTSIVKDKDANWEVLNDLFKMKTGILQNKEREDQLAKYSLRTKPAEVTDEDTKITEEAKQKLFNVSEVGKKIFIEQFPSLRSALTLVKNNEGKPSSQLDINALIKLYNSSDLGYRLDVVQDNPNYYIPVPNFDNEGRYLGDTYLKINESKIPAEELTRLYDALGISSIQKDVKNYKYTTGGNYSSGFKSKAHDTMKYIGQLLSVVYNESNPIFKEGFFQSYSHQRTGRTQIDSTGLNPLSNKLLREFVLLKKDANSNIDLSKPKKYNEMDETEKEDFAATIKQVILQGIINGAYDKTEFEILEGGVIQYIIRGKNGDDITSEALNHLNNVEEAFINGRMDFVKKSIDRQIQRAGNKLDYTSDGNMYKTNLLKLKYMIENNAYTDRDLIIELDGRSTGVSQSTLHTNTNSEFIQKGLSLHKYIVTDNKVYSGNLTELGERTKTFKKSNNIEDVLKALEVEPAYGNAFYRLKMAIDNIDTSLYEEGELENNLRFQILKSVLNQKGDASKLYKEFREIGKKLVLTVNYGQALKSISDNENSDVNVMLRDKFYSDLNALFARASNNVGTAIQMFKAAKDLVKTEAYADKPYLNMFFEHPKTNYKYVEEYLKGRTPTNSNLDTIIEEVFNSSKEGFVSIANSKEITTKEEDKLYREGFIEKALWGLEGTVELKNAASNLRRELLTSTLNNILLDSIKKAASKYNIELDYTQTLDELLNNFNFETSRMNIPQLELNRLVYGRFYKLANSFVKDTIKIPDSDIKLGFAKESDSTAAKKSTTETLNKINTKAPNNIITSGELDNGDTYFSVSSNISVINEVLASVAPLIEHYIEAEVMNSMLVNPELNTHLTVYDGIIIPISKATKATNAWNQGMQNKRQERPIFNLAAIIANLANLSKDFLNKNGIDVVISDILGKNPKDLRTLFGGVDWTSKVPFVNIPFQDAMVTMSNMNEYGYRLDANTVQELLDNKSLQEAMNMIKQLETVNPKLAASIKYHIPSIYSNEQAQQFAGKDAKLLGNYFVIKEETQDYPAPNNIIVSIDHIVKKHFKDGQINKKGLFDELKDIDKLVVLPKSVLSSELINELGDYNYKVVLNTLSTAIYSKPEVVEDTTPPEGVPSKKKVDIKHQIDTESSWNRSAENLGFTAEDQSVDEDFINLVTNLDDTEHNQEIISHRYIIGEVEDFINTNPNVEARNLQKQFLDLVRDDLRDVKVIRSKYLRNSKGIAFSHDNQRYVILSDNARKGNTLFHELIHATNIDAITNSESIGAMNELSKLRKLSSDILDILVNDGEAMYELGLIDDYGQTNSIFRAIQKDPSEFLSYFLSDNEKFNYLLGLTNKDLKQSKLNPNETTLGKIFRMFRQFVKSAINIMTMNKLYKDDVNAGQLLVDRALGLFQYNDKANADMLDNKLYNKITNKLNNGMEAIIRRAPILNSFTDLDKYIRENNYTQEDIDRISNEILEQFKSYDEEGKITRTFHRLRDAFTKSPLHRKVAMSILNRYLTFSDNVVAREMGRIFRDFGIINIRSQGDIEQLIGKKLVLDQQRVKNENELKATIQALEDQLLGENKDNLLKQDQEWNGVVDLENDTSMLNRYSPLDRFRRSLGGIVADLKVGKGFTTYRSNKMDSITLTEVLNELFFGSNRTIDNKYKNELKELQGIANELGTSIDKEELTFIDNGIHLLAATRISKQVTASSIESQAELLRKLKLVKPNSQLLNKLNEVLDGRDQQKQALYKDFMRSLDRLTTLRTLQYAREDKYYKDRIENIKENIGIYRERKLPEDKLQILSDMVTLYSNNLREARFYDTFSPTNGAVDRIIRIEQEIARAIEINDPAQKDYINQLQEEKDRLIRDNMSREDQFMTEDYRYDFTLDDYTSFYHNNEVEVITMQNMNGNYDADTQAKYYQALTNNNTIEDYESAIEYFLGLGYEIVGNSKDDNSITLKRKARDNYKQTNVPFAYMSASRVAEGTPYFDMVTGIKELDEANEKRKQQAIQDADARMMNELKQLTNEQTNIDKILQSMYANRLEYTFTTGSRTLLRKKQHRRDIENLVELDTSLESQLVSLRRKISNNKDADQLNADFAIAVLKDNLIIQKNQKELDKARKDFIKIYDENNNLNPEFGDVILSSNVTRALWATVKDYNGKHKGEEITELYISPDIAEQMLGIKTTKWSVERTKNISNPLVRKMLNKIETYFNATWNDIKETTIIRNPKVLYQNIMANYLTLMTFGLSPVEIARRTQALEDDLVVFERDMANYLSLKNKYDSIKNNADMYDKNEVKQLQREINNLDLKLRENRVFYPMMNGVDSNIVDESRAEDSIMDNVYKNAIKGLMDRAGVNRTRNPKWLDDLVLSQNSEFYRNNMTMNRHGDIIPRIIAYEMFQKEGNSKTVALSKAQDFFVNYNVPITSKALQFLERIGMQSFIRFNIKVQKAAAMSFMKYPVSTLAVVLGTSALQGMSPLAKTFIPNVLPSENMISKNYSPFGLLRMNMLDDFAPIINPFYRWGGFTNLVSGGYR